MLCLMFLGDGLSSMGGVVIRWALLEPDGRLLKRDIDSARRAARYPGIFSDAAIFE